MNKYKTVKEVCDLTGLTRKHLYYFHHQGIVRAVAYANYSVEGHTGYKLYDDMAVEKLQQIALYYQLGLRRDEIKKIMQSPNYDSAVILHELLALEQEKKLHIEHQIAALEYLILSGSKNGLSGVLRGISLEELGRSLLAVRDEASLDLPPAEGLEAFIKEFSALAAEFAGMDEAQVSSPSGAALIREMFRVSGEYLGSDSSPFMLGLFMSVLGRGSIAQGIAEQLSPAHARAVIRYMIDHERPDRKYPLAENAGAENKTGRNRT